jgi:hypothetical protein
LLYESKIHFDYVLCHYIENQNFFAQVQYCSYLVKAAPSLAYFLQLSIVAAVVALLVAVAGAAVMAVVVATLMDCRMLL